MSECVSECVRVCVSVSVCECVSVSVCVCGCLPEVAGVCTECQGWKYVCKKLHMCVLCQVGFKCQRCQVCSVSKVAGIL